MINTTDVVKLALEANRLTHTPVGGPLGPNTGPFMSARALGMAYGAMLATKQILAGGTAKLAGPNYPAFVGGLVADDAVASAGYNVLDAIYAPAAGQQDVRPALAAQWATISAGGNAASIAFGKLVADAVVAWRATDSALSGANPAYVPTGATGNHAPDPFDPVQLALGAPAFAGANWGGAPKFLVDQPALEPPFAVGSAEYAVEYDEVRKAGTADLEPEGRPRKVIGIFWGYDGPSGLGTPPRMYTQILLTVAAANGLSATEIVDLVGGAAIAMADAGIYAWHYKYFYKFWRPVIGIRKDPTSPSPTWKPQGKPDTNGFTLFRTPNFPAYPSGHATFGAAAFEFARRYLAKRAGLGIDLDKEVDPFGFSFQSDELNGVNLGPETQTPRAAVTRTFSSLWQAMVENAESRIWLGVHWRMDGVTVKAGGQTAPGKPAKPQRLGKIGGVRLGVDIGKAAAAKLL